MTSVPAKPVPALSALRGERPALALAVSFAPRAEREVISALLLLWLELLRAGLASEPLLSATRMAWWRDALGGRDAKGTPLAENLIALGVAEALAGSIEGMIGDLMEAERPASPNPGIAAALSRSVGADAEAVESLLAQLDGALRGKGAEPARTGHPALDLVQWCCREPTRLDYPDRHPLLAMRMLLASIRRWP